MEGVREREEGRGEKKGGGEKEGGGERVGRMEGGKEVQKVSIARGIVNLSPSVSLFPPPHFQICLPLPLPSIFPPSLVRLGV